MNVSSLLSAGIPALMVLALHGVGPWGSTKERAAPLRAPPRKVLSVHSFSNGPDLSFHFFPDLFFYTQGFFLQYTRSSPGQRDSTVQQALIVYHCALDTAAGAGDTGREKVKCLPLRSPKLGAASDKSAVRVGMEVAMQTRERGDKTRVI